MRLLLASLIILSGCVFAPRTQELKLGNGTFVTAYEFRTSNTSTECGSVVQLPDKEYVVLAGDCHSPLTVWMESPVQSGIAGAAEGFASGRR